MKYYIQFNQLHCKIASNLHENNFRHGNRLIDSFKKIQIPTAFKAKSTLDPTQVATSKPASNKKNK